MQLSRQSQIAIDVLLACAEEETAIVLTQQAAERANTTQAFAARVVGLLVRGGLLHSHRGRRGGLRLARTPGDIQLGEVLCLTQNNLENFRTEKGGASRLEEKPFDSVLRAATDSFLSMLDSFTLADLAQGAGQGRLACLECALWAAARRPPPRASHRTGILASRKTRAMTKGKSEHARL